MSAYMDTVKRQAAQGLSSNARINAARKRKTKRPAPKRVGYREALAWIMEMDDIEFIKDPDPILSVTAVMVGHLWEKEQHVVLADLRRLAKKECR